MLRKCFVLLLGLAFMTCKQKAETTVFFDLEVKEIVVTNMIEATVFANNQFIAFEATGHLIFINPVSFVIDSNLTTLFNNETFETYYLVYDSLILVKDDTEYYLNAKNELIPYGKRRMLFNQRNSEIVDVFEYQNTKFRNPIYRDSNVFMESFCLGEFGGTIYILDNKTKKQYCFPATCANSVNKINSDYYITISLAHMDGFSEVLKVSNVNNLKEVSFDTHQNRTNFWSNEEGQGDLDRFDSVMNEQRGCSQRILDTNALFIIVSFTYQSQLYHVYKSSESRGRKYGNRSEIYVGQIVNNEMRQMDSISVDGFVIGSANNYFYADWAISSITRNGKSSFVAIRENEIYFVNYINKAK